MRALVRLVAATVALAGCVGAPAAPEPVTAVDVAIDGQRGADAAELDGEADLTTADEVAIEDASSGPDLPAVADTIGAGADAAAGDAVPGEVKDVAPAQLDAGAAVDAQAEGAAVSDGAVDGDTSADAKPDSDAAVPQAALAKSETQPLWLNNGAFAKNATWPSAVAFAPAGFEPAGALHVIVYLHGHYNCATNVLGDVDTVCKTGGSKRPASKLASQLTATGVKALLLVPEVKVDEGSSDPGSFAKPGGFEAFLSEALGALQPPLLPRKVADVQTLVIASHSGGYLAAAGIATVGGVKVDQVWLLDSLYGAYPSFVTWAKQDLPGFGKAGSDWKRRLFVVYTDGGGTVTLSKQLAAEAKGWVPAGAWLHDQTTATWADADYGHGLLFKHSGLSHHGVTTYYFGKLVGNGPGP